MSINPRKIILHSDYSMEDKSAERQGIRCKMLGVWLDGVAFLY
ncbi:MAG: hypothetical protein K0Q48_264 [Bacillota bacterium]|jgi:hypothetical protein|nr:hypothetical protein [Bacillota bacterium]